MHGTVMLPKAPPQSQRRAAQRPCRRCDEMSSLRYGTSSQRVGGDCIPNKQHDYISLICN
ncbi:MAG: hypothetical protein R2822_23480 [Spirosomataceae bacterium]